MRRITVLILVLAMLTGLATPALADGDGDQKDEKKTDEVKKDEKKDGDGAYVELLTTQTPSMTAGDTVWIQFVWTSHGAEAEDFKVVVDQVEGGDIAYPANTGTYTSLMQDATLSDGEMDFTSIRLTVPYGTKKTEISLRLSYTVDGKGYKKFLYSEKPGKSEKSEKAKFKVPLDVFTGQDVSQVDYGAQTVAGDGGWIDLGYTGYAPVVTDFQVVVTDPAGFSVEYPQGSFTSLHHNSFLEDGETDIARVYLDTATVVPGDYAVTIEATWMKDGTPGSLVGTVPVVVTP